MLYSKHRNLWQENYLWHRNKARGFSFKIAEAPGSEILTIEWSYKFNERQKGTEIDFETMDNLEYLRTKRGDKLFDNLNSRLPMNVLRVN